MRGEKNSSSLCGYSVRGSPPYARGKATLRLILYSRPRITPVCAGKRYLCLHDLSHDRITSARAGKSGEIDHADCAIRDHPRACGEKLHLILLQKSQSGSPPRVRGKALCRAAPWYQPGITPACAGKSLFCAPLPLTGRDHPRACGEKLRGRRAAEDAQGSPPRVRGKAASVQLCAG